MKKTLLAVAIPAAIFANSVAAVQVYDDGKTTFAIGGHVSTSLVHDQAKDTTSIEDQSPRINFTAKTDLGNGLTAEAKAEWGLNMFSNADADTLFNNRLGYIAVHSDDFGSVTAGRQWSVFYDAVNATDAPIIFGNDFIYEGVDTGRASRAIAYRHGFDFGNAGAVDFGLQWAGSSSNNGWDRGQVGLAYSVAGFKLGYALSTGDVKRTVAAELNAAGDKVNETKLTDDSNVQAVSASYGNFGKGLMVGATYIMADHTVTQPTEFEDVKVAVAEAEGYDAIVSYGFKNGLTLSANYEILEDKNSDYVAYETSAVIAQQKLTKNFEVYGGHQFDLRDEDKYSDVGDQTIVGMRVYF